MSLIINACNKCSVMLGSISCLTFCQLNSGNSLTRTLGWHKETAQQSISFSTVTQAYRSAWWSGYGAHLTNVKRNKVFLALLFVRIKDLRWFIILLCKEVLRLRRMRQNEKREERLLLSIAAQALVTEVVLQQSLFHWVLCRFSK